MQSYGPKCNMKGMVLLLLSASVICIGGSDDISEECIVEKSFDCPNTSRDEFTWIALLTEETDLKMYVAYEDEEKNEISNSEVIHIQIDQIYREKTRNRFLTEREELIKNISLLLGWANFSTEVENKVMNITINSQIFPIEFEFPVRHVTIVSEPMISCLKGTPTWKITEDKLAIIPTVGQCIVHFSLFSNTSFSPVLTIEKMPIFLQYSSDVEIGLYNTSLPLPRGTYAFTLKKERTRWILYYKKLGSDPEVVLEVKMIDKLTNMRVGTLDEDFFLELNITNEVVEKSINSTSLYDPDQMKSKIGSIILGGIFIGIIFCFTIFFIYKRIKPKNERGWPQFKCHTT